MKRNLRDMMRKAGGNMEPSKKQLDGFMNQAKKYEGKSEAELMNELVASYKNGALKDEDLERFIRQAGPMLNPAQMQRLQSIIERLRS